MAFDATPRVSSKYGAPMGRYSHPWEAFSPAPVITYLKRVPLNSGGYDRGGAYWRLGEPLWVAYQLTSDGADYTARYFRCQGRFAQTARQRAASACWEQGLRVYGAKRGV
jgi:hypothetical protein